MRFPFRAGPVLFSIFAATAFAASESEPLWAYGFVKPAAPGEKAGAPGKPAHGLRANEDATEQTRPRRVPGSSAQYSLQQIRNGSDVTDWFPEDHPPMTSLIRHGPASGGDNTWGCAFCHLPSGKGKPENAGLAGLPSAYIVRQLQDFRDGRRLSADARKGNTLIMVELAKQMTDAEMKEAGDYFASMPWTPWIKIVETDRVPRTKTSAGLFIPIEKEKTELLGERIIEVPEEPEELEVLRNPRVAFIAYVPFGSVKKGEALVTTGGATVVNGQPVAGKTLACAACHGPDLKGMAEVPNVAGLVGPVPGIAGRSPSYLARQLFDLQQGTRKSPASAVMQPVVANLTNEDFVAISAYVSSLVPRR